MRKYKAKSGFIIKEPIIEIGDAEIKDAKKKYMEARSKGVILSDYHSNEWIVCDQKSKKKFVFDNNINKLRECLKNKEIDADHIVNSLKIFVLLRLGTCSLSNLKSFIDFALKEVEKSNGFDRCNIIPSKNNASHIYYYIEFIRIILKNKSDYLDQCEKCCSVARKKNAESKKNNRHPCELNEFQSYFRFDELIREWWNECSENERWYYYPLYLFWIITTILPMRVTEFCLTPFDCIRQDEGRYYLTIRRSRLKGGYKDEIKVHYYTIDKDYNKYEYEIPEWLYDSIKIYKDASDNYERPYNLLFSVRFLNDNKANKSLIRLDDRVFDREVLSDLLSDFYKNVVSKNYKIIDEDTLMNRYIDPLYGLYQMESGEMMKIQSKHTRHLSMINLILRGCNPMMIKEFAGHAIESTSCNYYGNVSKTVRCATKVLYDKVKSEKRKTVGVKEVNPLSLMINRNGKFVEVDEGKCYSEKFINGDPKDCSVCGGECIVCRFCVPNNKDFFYTDIKCEQLDDELLYLVKMLSEDDIESKLDEYQIRMQRLEKDLGNYAEKFYKYLVEGEEYAEK